MLIFTRKKNQGFTARFKDSNGETQNIKIVFLKHDYVTGEVRLGIDAPLSVEVDRDEIREKKDRGVPK